MSGRELKFRVWGSGKMWEVNALDFTGNLIQKGIPTAYNDKDGCFPIDYLMQFTGVKDRNGKDIYEGDILFVEYDNDSVSFMGNVIWGCYDDGEYVSNVECWVCKDDPISDNGGLWGSPKHTYEIIGNIYENPELL
jgi:uncharacterized phage protein (TIGR01671 family)